MSEKQETEIRKEKIVQAGTEMVFNALIEPEKWLNGSKMKQIWNPE